MSTNIHISYSGKVETPSGHVIDYYKSFNAYQTPTIVTAEILKAEDKIQAYAQWALEKFDKYDKNDHIFQFIESISDADYREDLMVKFYENVMSKDEIVDMNEFDAWANENPYISETLKHVTDLFSFVREAKRLGFDLDVSGY